MEHIVRTKRKRIVEDYYEENNLIEGEYISYHDNQNIAIKAYYVRGKKEGVCITYCKGHYGRIEKRENYVHGR